MRPKYIFFLLVFLSLLCATGPDIEWAKTIGGDGDQFGYSIQQTIDGGYIIAGSTDTSKDDYSKYVYIIKTDACGDSLWARIYNEGVARSVQQTFDGGYIIAGWTHKVNNSETDILLIKINENGDKLWTRIYGGDHFDGSYSIQQTQDKGFIIVGYTESFGKNGDVYLIKTDKQGDILWTKVIGEAYLPGKYATDCGCSVRQTLDLGYVVAGWTTKLLPTGDLLEKDVYLVKTNRNGGVVWKRTYGSDTNDVGYSVQQTSDGGYIIAGSTYSFRKQSDVYIIRTDSYGKSIWAKTYGTSYDDFAYAVQPTLDGGYLVAGCSEWYDSLGSGDYLYLLKIDEKGEILWERKYGETKMAYGYSVQQTKDRGYIVVGWTWSFDNENYDIYLIKTKPDVK